MRAICTYSMIRLKYLMSLVTTRAGLKSMAALCWPGYNFPLWEAYAKYVVLIPSLRQSYYAESKTMLGRSGLNNFHCKKRTKCNVGLLQV